MPNIVINVNAKEQTWQDCIKLSPSKNYTDTITKDRVYDDDMQISVTFINYCNVPYNVEGFTLFTDTTNGGNFTASVNSFTIGANQTLVLPVFYNGIHKSENEYMDYTVSLNGVSVNYRLNILKQVVNVPPVTQNMAFSMPNRTNKTFALSDFTSKFYDMDGDTLDSIMVFGSVENFRLYGNPITNGQEIPASQIPGLTYLAPNTDASSSVTITYKAKDSRGAVSN